MFVRFVPGGEQGDPYGPHGGAGPAESFPDRHQRPVVQSGAPLVLEGPSVTLSPLVLAVLVAVVVIAGLINGVAGFGFALMGTMALATVVDPAVAVVFMILPIFGVNLSLVRELSVTELAACGDRFGPLLLAGVIGTVAGMVVLERLPAAPLRLALGVVSLGFVLNAQELVSIPGLARAREGCFVETPLAMVGVGAASGVLFGGTNVGVQFVAYVRSCDLSHGVFVGVVAMIFVGINGVRIATAGVLGLYPNRAVLAASVAVTVPAIVGVVLGSRLRPHVTDRQRRAVVFGLLTAIGGRLVLEGVGVV